jgi:23S rRNA (uracil1939-C5)-methyltransferase
VSEWPETWVPIVRMAARGDGVTADGRFVPATVPGDRVRFDPFAVEPGPDHATPPCRHFPDCGGCMSPIRRMSAG